MNHHIPQQATRDFNIISWWRRGIATGDDHHFQLSDLAISDRFCNGPVAGIVATVETELDRDIAVFDFIPAAINTINIQIDRFFAQNRFTRFGGPNDQIHMSVSAGSDQNGVKRRIGQRLVDIGDRCCLVLTGHLGCCCCVDIIDIAQCGGGIGRDQISVHTADTASAQQSEIHHNSFSEKRPDGLSEAVFKQQKRLF